MRNTLRTLGWACLALVLLTGFGVLVTELLRDTGVPQSRPVTTVMRVILPPPPAPPPTPQPPPPQQPQKMIEAPKPKQQPQEAKPLQQAKQAPPGKPAAVPAPPGNPLTAEPGAGPSQYGLGVGNGAGNTIGGGGGGGGGSRLGYYAGLIASQVQAALQNNEQTRYLRLHGITVRVWLSPSGQITRCELVNTTGETARDETLSRVLAGVSLHETWPPDLPQPVVVRIGTQG